MKSFARINEYFDHAARLLDTCPVVRSRELYTQKRTATEGYLRGDVWFTNGSHLHFRELLSVTPSFRLVSYAYQYMNAQGALIFRYDNAPHFPHLPTAPHHKHVGEGEVIAAAPPDLETILREIETRIETL